MQESPRTYTMVLFENIVLNQRVEVRMRNGIYKGTVKYKGPINGVPGDWVGVALEEPGNQLCFEISILIIKWYKIHFGMQFTT